MKILFQNDHFIALEKPAGWLTTPARFGDKDFRPVLGLELQKNLGRQVYPLHRLDYEVSGLVLFALDAKAHSEGNTQFENRKVKKTYLAITENKIATLPEVGAKFEWKSRILRGKKRSYESPHGKPSLTLAQFTGCGVVDGLSEFGEGLRWELHPVTGRSHQLRYDLSRHGFPICGDQLYGASPESNFDSIIALRSIDLRFEDGDFRLRWKLPELIQVNGN